MPPINTEKGSDETWRILQMNRGDAGAACRQRAVGSPKGGEMSRARFFLFFASVAIIVSCSTTNSNLYDPNAPVTAIDITTHGSVDPSSRTIALPPGDDELLLALKNAFSGDGWVVSTSTTNTRYVMLLQTQVWTYEQRLSHIDLSVVDQKTGSEVLSGVRNTKSPYDPPIDVKAVADLVVASLKKVTSPPAQ